jgi:hypothetical protein
MTDPIVGVKYGVLLAGFAGGVVSLSFVKNLTRTQAVLAVLTGAFSANYLTPVALYYLEKYSGPVSGDDLPFAVAFIIGLTAMNVIPGILKMSLLFKRRPQIVFPKGDEP